MMTLLKKRHRRPILSFQLTTMIDIFVMIIIFLIKGTVFGSADVAVDAKLKLPESISKESVEAAPKVIINQEGIRTWLNAEPLPREIFTPGTRKDARVAKLQKDLKQYLEGLPAESKAAGAPLSIVADKSVSYQDIFNTVVVFRESGFQTLLFVATGPSESANSAAAAPAAKGE